LLLLLGTNLLLHAILMELILSLLSHHHLHKQVVLVSVHLSDWLILHPLLLLIDLLAHLVWHGHVWILIAGAGLLHRLELLFGFMDEVTLVSILALAV
jgi:hypothetical protein